MEQMTIEASIWFSGIQGHFGLVLVNNGHQLKAYIGSAEAFNLEVDKQSIANYGAPFPIEAALLIFNMQKYITKDGLIGVCKAHIWPASTRDKIPTEKQKAYHDVCCELLKIYQIPNEMENK